MKIVRWIATVSSWYVKYFLLAVKIAPKDFNFRFRQKEIHSERGKEREKYIIKKYPSDDPVLR